MKTAPSHSATVSKAAVAWYRLRTATPYIAVPLIVFTVFGSLFWFGLRRSEQQRDDITGVPRQAGSATIVSKCMQARGIRTVNGSVWVSIQLGIMGRLATITALPEDNIALANVGDIIPITYCIGKSGVYYVVAWQAPPRKIALPR